MLSRALRLLLFRVLPRRLAPVLLVWEAFQVVRRLRRRGAPAPTTPRRIRTVGGSNERRRGRGRARTSDEERRAADDTEA